MTIKRFLVLGAAVLGFGFLVLGSGSGVLAQQPPQPSARTRTASYELTDGRTIEGVPLNHERADDIQLRTNERLHRSAQKIRHPLSRRYIRRRLAELRRFDDRQPLQPPHADRQIECRPAGAQMDLHHPDVVAPAGDAGGRRRRHVRHQRQRVLCARCRQRPRDLALSTAAHERPRRQCGRRHQSRRRRRGRACVHGDRPRAPARAQSIHRRTAVGHRDGRLAAELQRHVGAVDRRRFRRCGHGRGRAGRARVSRRVRSEPPEKRRGGSGRCRSRASRDRRHGRAQASNSPAARRG